MDIRLPLPHLRLLGVTGEDDHTGPVGLEAVDVGLYRDPI